MTRVLPGPTDVAALIGQYPFRLLPHPDPDVLVRVLDREGLKSAWVGHLPSVFLKDPSHGNAELYRLLEPFRDRLSPVPAIRPDWPAWERQLRLARDEGAVAIRAWPRHWGMGAGHSALGELASACASHALSMVLTVRLEDSRQRHPLDVAGDIDASTIRSVARSGSGGRIVVIGAGRSLIEEVHWGLTEPERRLIWYDTSWIWGPPEDDFAHLLRTIGPERFLYGTGWPMRLVQVTRANMALLPDDLRGMTLADPASW